jgi:hypothetical protein
MAARVLRLNRSETRPRVASGLLVSPYPQHESAVFHSVSALVKRMQHPSISLIIVPTTMNNDIPRDHLDIVEFLGDHQP